jgi:hypothetical protein
MLRLWSERRWIKLTLAHGCYWHRCAFCDTSLDYIRRFDPADAPRVLDWMADTMAQTGETGFHFTDEAAPPALLRKVAEGILERNWRVQWWANIRFEPAFDAGLCRLLARSGCVAMTGGLECACDRLLNRMSKGIAMAGAARVLRALSRSGIMTHAYLMYGFPGQTRRDVLGALESIRRLFASGDLHSAYWHRFALTVHSPIIQALDDFGLPPSKPWTGRFAQNEVSSGDARSALYDRWSDGLRTAVFHYMHGMGLNKKVRSWFPE